VTFASTQFLRFLREKERLGAAGPSVLLFHPSIAKAEKELLILAQACDLVGACVSEKPLQSTRARHWEAVSLQVIL
jgi:hypothetical protein